jgi:uncharacterized protein YcgI (DUF1989 family)
MPRPELYDVPMTDIRPLLPSKREDDANTIYAHTSTDLVVGTIMTINVPRGVRYILAQAIDQNIRYVISGSVCDPSQTSGFQLVAGNDPLAISVLGGQTVDFIAEAAGARLEMQFCQ